MNLLPFDSLPAYKPRRFVPASIDLGDWAHVAPLFDQLQSRADQCKTVADLERWLLDWGELGAALDEESSRRYIAMTCHTDSPEAEKAYLHFVENIEPQLKPRQFALETLYVSHPLRSELLTIRRDELHESSSSIAQQNRNRTRGAQPSGAKYEVLDRDVKNHVELFRPENVSLETEEARLCQQYQKLNGSLTVHFRGEERTLPQMGRFFEEPDRSVRQQAWELVSRRRLQERDNFEDQFDQLIRLREQIAKNAGFSNYLEYAFRRLGRFDYKPEDCEKFHDSVATEVMPVVRELQAERRRQLGLEKLRPWDMAVDPLNRPPLKPFAQVGEMVSRTQQVFDKLDGELASGFRKMKDLHLLDLDNRKGKAPGGYQSTLAESRLPFIFMNAVGLQRDVETILHEAGHAFHALATREEDIYPYRSAPIEFCEVASMSMELLGNEFLEEFYPTGTRTARNDRTPQDNGDAQSSNANRARRTHLEGVVGLFPWVATVDAFQHWIYTHPGHTRDERATAWLALMDRFGGEVDWRGHEDARAHLWHRQLHIFLHPFYYIEYGIAQLGALQVWANSKRDKARALSDYKQSLALGGSRPLPELFKAAGCRFEFNGKTIKPLVQLVQHELAALNR